MRNINDRPEEGKQYALTGGTGEKCIANGNTWAESEIKEPIQKRIEEFVKLAQSLQYAEDSINYRLITVQYGKKYAKLVMGDRGGSMSVYCFVDLLTGSILKAASWKTPHPIPRANIYDADCGRSGISMYGAKYMDALTPKAKMAELKK